MSRIAGEPLPSGAAVGRVGFNRAIAHRLEAILIEEADALREYYHGYQVDWAYIWDHVGEMVEHESNSCRYRTFQETESDCG
jgi:hypothetical protein